MNDPSETLTRQREALLSQTKLPMASDFKEVAILIGISLRRLDYSQHQCPFDDGVKCRTHGPVSILDSVSRGFSNSQEADVISGISKFMRFMPKLYTQIVKAKGRAVQ